MFDPDTEKRVENTSDLVPRVSHLTAGKMRDPGNEVEIRGVWKCCQTLSSMFDIAQFQSKLKLRRKQK